jgi:sugar phosphate isomerase/epimerase
MKTIKGPALFLAQFAGDEAPFNSWESITKWAADCGYKGRAGPELGRAADRSRKGRLVEGLLRRDSRASRAPTASRSPSCRPICRASLSPCIRPMTRPSTALRLRKCAAIRRRGRQWAVEQVKMALTASRNMGIDRAWRAFPARWPGPMSIPGRSARRAWSRPPSTSWPGAGGRSSITPRRCGVDICYEIHPGEDLHDGVTFEMFLERVGNHARCNMLYDPSHYVLQCLDYLDNIDIYNDRIRMFHVKDAEFNPTGRQGVYSGYQSWVDRAGRFRSLGDGQVDFGAIFSKLAANDFDGWAVVEWECCLKHPEDGAREGAQPSSRDHIIRVTEKAFDDFADGGTDDAANRRMLGIS